jgi:predicted GH43/DUF377 family glycosyl hydrolase
MPDFLFQAPQPPASSFSVPCSRRQALKIHGLAVLGFAFGQGVMTHAASPAPMRWADTSRGKKFAKDPSVIRWKDRYLMYYSIPPFGDRRPGDCWVIGIAESRNLTDWTKVGEVPPEQACERNGLVAPGAWIHEGKVHLFYSTYGNGAKDAICHAWSEDGIIFTREPSNPIFAPSGAWTSGRAIDPEVFPVGDRLLLYFATRDPEMKVQMIGVAAAPLGSDFSRPHWKQLGNGPILKPELPWERRCIEAPTLLRRGDTLWMFYAGGYNNEPQQIGVATSPDGLAWTRFSDRPLIPHGPPGSWNSSESGHPGVFVDHDGRTHLFFQGNNDAGQSWYLSRLSVDWPLHGPLATP